MLGKSGTQRDKMAVDAMKGDLTRKGEGHEGCILLVVPATVMQQWIGELDKWGWFAIAKLGGSNQGADERERALSDAAEGRAEVAICSYEFLWGHAMRNVGDKDEPRWENNKAWDNIKWRLVVFDEVHAVKNTTSARSQCAKVRWTSFRLARSLALSISLSLFFARLPARFCRDLRMLSLC